VVTRPVLIGLVTFLLLGKPGPGRPAGFRPLDRLDDLVDRYVEVLATLDRLGVAWVQLDEPALVADITSEELAAVRRTYGRLASLAQRPALLVASYFAIWVRPCRCWPKPAWRVCRWTWCRHRSRSTHGRPCFQLICIGVRGPHLWPEVRSEPGPRLVGLLVLRTRALALE
jgi:Cobalamin-independent synthase, N-terminal domain